jgi:hypothetical protein
MNNNCTLKVAKNKVDEPKEKAIDRIGPLNVDIKHL